MPDAPIGWFPVVTLLAGFAVKSASDWVQHRRTLERDREAREAARRDQLSERRATFQRQTLLDLQEAVMQLARTTGAMHHQDIVALGKTGEWHPQRFPDDLNESDRLANARTTMFAVRVQDKSIRELVQAFKDHAVAVTGSKSREASNSALLSMMGVLVPLNERIGEILRKLDEEF